jgi:hypothetical protein
VTTAGVVGRIEIELRSALDELAAQLAAGASPHDAVELATRATEIAARLHCALDEHLPGAAGRPMRDLVSRVVATLAGIDRVLNCSSLH